MKQHISDIQQIDLQLILDDWHAAREQQARCIDALWDKFDCEPDEAIDVLNMHRTAAGVVSEYGIEIHEAAKCRQPWRVDGQALCVWLLVIGGGLSVAWMA